MINQTTPPAAPRPVAISTEHVSVNKDVYQAKEKLIAAVFDFLAVDQNPVNTINQLLYTWLTTKATIQPGHFDAHYLKQALEMSGLFYELFDKLRSLEYYEREADKLAQQPQEGPAHD